MSVRLIKVAYQKDMIKVNEDGKEIWYDCDKAAKGYAKQNFKEATVGRDGKTVLEQGDEISLAFETRDNKQCVVRVSKPGSAPYNPPAQSQPSQAAPASRPAYEPKSADTQAMIVRQSTMASASRSVQVLTGQIQDENVLAEKVISIYRKLLTVINE